MNKKWHQLITIVSQLKKRIPRFLIFTIILAISLAIIFLFSIFNSHDERTIDIREYKIFRLSNHLEWLEYKPSKASLKKSRPAAKKREENLVKSTHEFKGVLRTGLTAKAGDRFSIKLYLPGKAVLDFGIGVLKSKAPSSFRIYLENKPGQKKRIFYRDIKNTDIYPDLHLNLTGFDSQPVTLQFEMESRDQEAIGIWYEPIIYKPTETSKIANVILILIDTLRADHLGSYGYYRKTSPALDNFARQGVRFSRAYSNAPWTKPSVASLFTSLYPSTHRTQKGQFEQYTKHLKVDTLNQSIKTIAETLKENGYVTVGFCCNPHIKSIFGFAQGFDTWDERWGTCENINQRALSWLKKNGSKPFFLYLHYMDVHGPYQPPKPYDELFKDNDKRQIPGKFFNSYLRLGNHTDLGYYIAQYDGQIKYLDDQLQIFFNEISGMGIEDNTLFILTSDHGEEFLDHGGMEHGFTLYNEMLHVPLIMKMKRVLPRGVVIENPVQSIDILPSILHLLNIKHKSILQGKNFISILEKNQSPQNTNPFVFSEMLHKGNQIAIYRGQFKYIKNNNNKSEMLFDLAKDPLEQVNLAGQLQEKIRIFRNIFKKVKISTLVDFKKLKLKKDKNVELDENLKKELKSLGYLD